MVPGVQCFRCENNTFPERVRIAASIHISRERDSTYFRRRREGREIQLSILTLNVRLNYRGMATHQDNSEHQEVVHFSAQSGKHGRLSGCPQRPRKRNVAMPRFAKVTNSLGRSYRSTSDRWSRNPRNHRRISVSDVYVSLAAQDILICENSRRASGRPL